MIFFRTEYFFFVEIFSLFVTFPGLGIMLNGDFLSNNDDDDDEDKDDDDNDGGDDNNYNKINVFCLFFTMAPTLIGPWTCGHPVGR